MSKSHVFDKLPALPDKSEMVVIIWKDAVGDSSRMAADSIQDAQLVINANFGWIIHQNEERLVLAHGLSTSGEVDYFVIPVNCVIEKRELFPKRQKRQPKPKPQA
jgi:hypothetical protein